MSYWDTSCLVKLYTPESDSPVFASYLATHPSCVTADLSLLEFWATVRRKETEGTLATGEAQRVQTALEQDGSAGAISIVEIDQRVRVEYKAVVHRCLSQTPPIYIRTNDAQHLAAAKCAGESEIVATDKKLRDAALLLGFTVFPPPSPA
jgi:predicted nucleic acid-binding protein